MTAAAHPLGRPAASKQSSRKSKAAWRKNISLDPAVENPSAALPPAPHTLTNDQLFAEDRRPDHSAANVVLGLVPQRKRKASGSTGLKSLEVLRNKSDTPAVVGRKKGTGANKDSTRVSKELKNSLRRIAHRPVNGSLGGTVDENQVGTTGLKEAAATAEFNIWDARSSVSAGAAKGKKRKTSHTDGDASEEDDEWIEDQRRVLPKVPRTLDPSRQTASDSVALARSLPALPTPHPGTSYNPTAEDHAALLEMAYKTEARKEAEERKSAAFKAMMETNRRAARKRALDDDPDAGESTEKGGSKKSAKAKGKQAELERIQATLVKLAGMDSTAPEIEEDDKDENVSEVEDSDEEEDDKVYDVKRKTKAQRARALRAKQEHAAALARKQTRIARAALYTLPSMRKRALAAARARAEAAAALQKKKEDRVRHRGLEGVRVGRNKVGESAIRTEVQLEEDLAEGLRGVKPEGNLFRDRFQSFQTRALVEPGSNKYPVQKQGKTGRRGKKEYEVPAYRHFK